MRTVAEYNPLKRIRLPGAVIEDPSGLIIIIGPNSSGKTHLLNDIQNYLTGGKSNPIVCKSFAANKPASLGDYLQDLQKENLLKKVQGDQYMPYVATLMDSKDQTQKREIQNFNEQIINKAYQDFNTGDAGNTQAFFEMIGPVLVAPLTLEMRRDVCNNTPSFDWQRARPALPLQALQLTTEGQDRLSRETGKVFGNVVWLDTVSVLNTYQLKVTGSPHLPTGGERTK